MLLLELETFLSVILLLQKDVALQNILLKATLFHATSATLHTAAFLLLESATKHSWINCITSPDKKTSDKAKTIEPGAVFYGVVNGRPRHSIEARCSAQCVRAHVLEDQPITDVELRKMNLFEDAVEAVTRRTPDAALELKAVRMQLKILKK